MIDHIPDQTYTYSCDSTWEKSECTMHSFEFGKLGIYHKNKDKCNSYLSDDTCNHKVDIMSECLPESGVMGQLSVIRKSGKSLVWTASPIKKAVYQSSNQRNKYSKHKIEV